MQKKLDSVNIAAGLNKLSAPEDGFQNITIAGITPHPNFNRSTLESDICILKLKNPLVLSGKRRTAMVKLPPPGYTACGGANVTGWGRTNDGTEPDALMRVTVPIIPDNVCRMKYPTDLIVDEMICAGGEEGKGSCSGDSGGPLVDSQGFLVGVVTGGGKCGSKYPNVFAEVSYFTRWIKNHILVNSTLEDPVSS